MAEDLLSADNLAVGGYLRSGPIEVLWQQHLSRRGQWDRQLWNALMFEAWLDAQRAEWGPA